MNHPSLSPLTSNIWLNNNDNLDQTIASYQRALKDSNNVSFGNLFKEINRTKARLSGVQRRLKLRNNSSLLQLEKQLELHLKQLLENEESIWLMKSRLQWISLSDRNTKFLQMTALNKRRKNRIN